MAYNAALVLGFVVVVLMLGTVVLHTRLAERQREIDRLEAAVTEAAERFDVLRQQRAELRSPTRLAIEARGCGMVPTPRTEFLPVDPQTLAEVIAAAGDRRRRRRARVTPRTRSTRSGASRRPTGAAADGASPPEPPATRTESARPGRIRTSAPADAAGAASTHRPAELPPRVGAPVGRRADPPRPRRPTGIPHRRAAHRAARAVAPAPPSRRRSRARSASCHAAPRNDPPTRTPVPSGSPTRASGPGARSASARAG